MKIEFSVRELTIWVVVGAIALFLAVIHSYFGNYIWAGSTFAVAVWCLVEGVRTWREDN